MPARVTTHSSLDEWKHDVAAALADPDHFPFIAAVAVLVVIGGEHTEYDWCWCQPAQRPHGDHTHGDHRRTMD